MKKDWQKYWESYLSGAFWGGGLATSLIILGILVTSLEIYEFKSKVLEAFMPNSESGLIAVVKEEFSNQNIDQTIDQLKPPEHFIQKTVFDADSLSKTLAEANKRNGNFAIYLQDGIYNIQKPMLVRGNNIWFLSASRSPINVVIKGRGMKSQKSIDHIFLVQADGFVLDGITLAEVGHHLIHIQGEKGANFPTIRNAILRDSYQQMIKVTHKPKPNAFSRDGLIENSLFFYSKGIAPNWYTGGVDAHGVRNWIIRKNVFSGISSPSMKIAEHAIHLWKNSAHNNIEGNIVLNSDRGIGLGMGDSLKISDKQFSNYGGVVRNNFIFHSGENKTFSDTGIVIESSPNTIIENNYIYLNHDYPRGIEYRFLTTRGVIISSNHTNKTITSRNSGKGQLINNTENLNLNDFMKQLDKFSSSNPIKKTWEYFELVNGTQT